MFEFSEIEESLASIGFFPKHVQGLYSYTHFAHVDGIAFVQVPLNARNRFVASLDLRFEYFDTFAALNARLTAWVQEY